MRTTGQKPPKPTGEYTKWQLRDSVQKMANAASDDALSMIRTASRAYYRDARSLDKQTRNDLKRLLNQAKRAWWEGKMAEKSARHKRYEQFFKIGT